MSTNESNSPISDELLSAYLDGELSTSEQTNVEARLAVDAAAREMVEELKAVSLAVRELPRQGADANLQDAVLRRVRQQAQVSPQPNDEVGSEETFTVGRSKRGWVWAVATIAAALFVMAYQGQFGPEGQVREVAQHTEKSVSSRPEPESKEMPGFVNAPAPVAQGGGGGGVADFAFSEPMPAPSSGLLGEESAGGLKLRRGRVVSAKPAVSVMPIVVQLTMPVESRRNRALENVLAGQQIVAAWEGDQLKEKYSRVEISSFKGISIEVISVAAPQRDILSCLAAIEKDTRNFLNVDVQELLPDSFNVDSLADISLENAELGDRVKSADDSANQWKQFNRSGPAPRQQFSQPSNEFRRLQSRKSKLADRSSSRSNENWQQVYFVIGSEQSTPLPTKKAKAN